MLVLSRKHHESIRIGHDIEVCILEISVARVRLGIVAPQDVPIHRDEIYDVLRRQAAEAMAANINAAGDDTWTAEKILSKAQSCPLFMVELQLAMDEIIGFKKDVKEHTESEMLPCDDFGMLDKTEAQS